MRTTLTDSPGAGYRTWRSTPCRTGCCSCWRCRGSALPADSAALDLLTGTAVVRRVALSPLDRDGVAQLVEASRVDDLLRRERGQPAAADRARPGPDRPDAAGYGPRIVAVRLRQCGPAVPSLQAAAVLGRRVDLDLLAGVLDTNPLTLLDHLDVGVRHFFLVERHGALIYRHELIRLAVAADAGPTRQAWLTAGPRPCSGSGRTRLR